MSETLRITRFGPADCGGSYLAFASDDAGEFYGIVATIKALGYAHAQWTPAVKAWWLSPSGLARLCGRYPDLSWLIGEYVRTAQDGGAASGEASGAGQRGGHGRAGGSAGRGSQRRAKSAKSASGVPADVAQALAALYVAPDAPAVVVSAAYRALAKTTHPDAGGDTATMQRLNLAYELAAAWASQHGATLASV